MTPRILPPSKAVWPPATMHKRPCTVPVGNPRKQTLGTIAADAGVDVWTLTEFNFANSDRKSSTINWYLHHKVGCQKTTRDGNNYVFSGGETIYLPIVKTIHLRTIRRGRLAILTPLGNLKSGYGPGHSAIVYNSDVYSFEGSGWIKIRTRDYLAKNKWRPVIVQELHPRIDSKHVIAYIEGAIQDDANYIWNGVCSTQVAWAIEAGILQPFNSKGVDTPAKVYTMAKRLGLATREYFYWPGDESQTQLARAELILKLNEYPNVSRAPAGGVASW